MSFTRLFWQRTILFANIWTALSSIPRQNTVVVDHMAWPKLFPVSYLLSLLGASSGSWNLMELLLTFHFQDSPLLAWAGQGWPKNYRKWSLERSHGNVDIGFNRYHRCIGSPANRYQMYMGSPPNRYHWYTVY